MDWAWVYSTLVRTTGWTFEQCEQQPCDRVFALLDNLARYPAEHTILAAVYGMKPVDESRPKSAEIDLAAAAPLLGAAQPMPPAMVAMMEAANAKFAGKKLPAWAMQS